MKYHYTGNGAFLMHLPARDFDEAELGPEALENLPLALSMGLYAAADGSTPHPGEAAFEALAPTRAPRPAAHRAAPTPAPPQVRVNPEPDDTLAKG